MNTHITHDKLNGHARLADLSISRFIGGRQDRKATAEVEENHKINSGQGGRFVKALIRPDYLKAINQVASRIRENFYKFTLPWHGEQRVLPISSYQSFIAIHDKLVAEFNELADELAAKYHEIKCEAELRLNGLFNPSEYPKTSESFRQKFSVAFDQFSFPRETDLNDPALQARAKQAVSARLADCHASLLERVAEVVGKFGQVLAKSDAVFRDSTVHSVADVIDEAECLNFTGNAEIATALANARKTLAVFNDPEVLRNDKTTRAQAVSASKSVLSTLESLRSTLGASA